MDTLPNPQPENLIVVTSLLTLAFHRHLSAKEGVTGKKRLELISNVSTTDFVLLSRRLAAGLKIPINLRLCWSFPAASILLPRSFPKAFSRSALSEPGLPASAGGSIPTVGDPVAVPALRLSLYFTIPANSRWSSMPGEP